MSKVYRDGDAERLSRRLADHLTIGPDGMTPADHWSERHLSEGGCQVSISAGPSVSVTVPHFDDASAILLELVTQEVLASLTPSLVTDADIGPESRADGYVSTAAPDGTPAKDGLTDESPWAPFVES